MVSHISQKLNFKIGNHHIGAGKCFIVAEIGVNHNGSLKLARKLIDSAKNAGADAVKFQTFKATRLVRQNAPQAKYQKKNFPSQSQYQMLKKLELSENDFKNISKYCAKKNIIFFSTPFDCESASFLNTLNIPAFKISSADITDLPLLKQIGKYKKPVILSTGMSTLKEIRQAVNTLKTAGNNKIALLHCTSNYPANYDELNIKSLETLKKTFNLPVGYSDHSIGYIASVIAVTLGASIIEKHFTIDKNLPGPDHKASANPSEFKEMVKYIREAEKMLGDGNKQPSSNEKQIAPLVRKSIVSAQYIPAHTVIKPSMLTVKRPADGISPASLPKVIGKKTTVDIPPDSPIHFWMFK